MSLFVAELVRFLSRRALRVVALLALGVLALIVVLTLVNADEGFTLVTMKDVAGQIGAPLIVLGMPLGATFIGAEWGAGTMTTILTWEPRRVRVHLVKVAAAMLLVFVGAFLVQTLVIVAMLPAAMTKGSTAGVDADWARDVGAVFLRGSLVTALAAAIGYSIASLARNTTTAVVIGFVYLMIAEPLIRGLKGEWQPWLLSDNAALFITSEQQIFAEARTATEAATVLAFYGLLFVGVSTALFARRDVT